MPASYKHREQDAVVAAANYARVLSSTLILGRSRRHAAIETLSVLTPGRSTPPARSMVF